MKVILENFGPIRKVEFDLAKDLNVVFGKNNIGKSYSITVLYLILKHLLSGFEGWGFSSAIYQGIIYGSNLKSQPKESSSPYEDVIKEARSAFRHDSKLTDYELSLPLALLLKDLFSSTILEQLGASFNNSFQSVSQLTNSRVSEQLLITLETAQFTLFFRVKGDEIVLDEVQFAHPVFVKKIKTNRTPSISERRTTLYFKASGKDTKESRSYDGDRNSIINALFMLIGGFRQELWSITNNIYFLPASRSGLYQALSAFGAVIAELSKSRHFVTSNFSLPSISEPVADYFLRLSSITPFESEDEIQDIARQIEAEVLGGEVGFNQQTKKLFFSQKQLDHEMDLSFTSSMISEIAPIVAYLKYVLRRESGNNYQRFHSSSIHLGNGEALKSDQLPPSLIFIEEPEAHLHPEVQVKLMEFFARLTKHNVKVVMTSHSNYMFNKLSNLLLTGELKPEKVGSYLMRATPEGSVMDPAAMRAEEEGIADENFVDVAEQLYNERLEAYDMLNAK